MDPGTIRAAVALPTIDESDYAASACPLSVIEDMTSPSVLWLERGTSVPGRTSQALAVCLAIAWALLLAARASEPLSPGRLECSNDPWDFLPIGEAMEPSSLAFLVEAHCANARYMPDGWIELSYGGARVDVQLRRVDIAGKPFFRVASIGGMAAP